MAKLPARVAHEKRQQILELVRQGSATIHACEHVGYDRSSFYKAREADPDLKQAYEDALLKQREARIDTLMGETMNRALNGTIEETWTVDEQGVETLKVKRRAKSPADVANAMRAYGIGVTERVEVEHHGEVNSPDVAAAIERFTALTAAAIRAAAGERPALPAGDADA